MSEPTIINEEAAHRIFAAGCFNKIWTLLEKQERTPDDNEMMIHLAHTSLYHWLQVGKPINEQRGEWMLARVYTVLEDRSKAFHHAKRCLALTEKYDFKDFDLAFAYEAMSRASALIGNKQDFRRYLEMAQNAGEEIKEKGDYDVFINDLNSGPWFGMKEI